MASPNERRTKIFISYSQESQAHRVRVYQLKARLMRNGIQCDSDHSFAHKAPTQGWLAWMEAKIKEADYVLVICTETYRRRAERKEAPGVGLGVIRETTIINQEIYNQAGRNDRFIPVILDDAAKAHIPDWLREWTYYHVETEEGYELLLRHLLDMPLYEEPELGEIPVLPPRVRATDALLRKAESAPPLIVTPQPEIVRPQVETPRSFAVNLGGNVKLEMICLEPGTFMMGSDEYATEKPPHRVTIAQPFFIGKFQVTQAQWQAVMKSNPSNFKDEPDLPVECVSWDEAVKFCERLSELAKRGGYEYRLPTEAEWEYACRAGTVTRFCFGDKDEGLGGYAWYTSNSQGKTHPVGWKNPNPWGLYDMHGNVWEWCQDSWHENYSDAPNNGSAWLSGADLSHRMLRGGSWDSNPFGCRAAIRHLYGSGARVNFVGLRVVARVRTS